MTDIVDREPLPRNYFRSPEDEVRFWQIIDRIREKDEQEVE